MAQRALRYHMDFHARPSIARSPAFATLLAYVSKLDFLCFKSKLFQAVLLKSYKQLQIVFKINIL